MEALDLVKIAVAELPCGFGKSFGMVVLARFIHKLFPNIKIIICIPSAIHKA